MDVEARRHQRSRDIIVATRALFDEHGQREAQIEDIASAVGINRAIIYRHFQTKEELFAVTLVEYLDELEGRLADLSLTDDPIADLEAQIDCFIQYGIEFPAFTDCAQSLLKYRGAKLLEDVSLSRLTELGTSIRECFAHILATLLRGKESGEFDIPDPELLINVFYTQGLGILNLITFQKSIREVNSGLPVMEDLPAEDVLTYAKRAMVAMARSQE